jgi:hypothetical protein
MRTAPAPLGGGERDPLEGIELILLDQATDALLPRPAQMAPDAPDETAAAGLGRRGHSGLVVG